MRTKLMFRCNNTDFLSFQTGELNGGEGNEGGTGDSAGEGKFTATETNE